MASVSGKEGYLTLGGVSYCMKQWSLDVSVNVLDSTTANTANRRTVRPGISSVSASATLVYQTASTDPWIALRPGNFVTAVFGLETTSANSLTTGTATMLVASCGLITVVDGEIQQTIKLEGSGVDLSVLLA